MNTRGELARTSSRAFAYTKLGEVSIPDGVKELGESTVHEIVACKF